MTLYANGIRYLEKAPLLYWSMAASMRLSQLLGHLRPRALAVAARVPLALTVLALALACGGLRAPTFRSAHAGLYAALIVLSSPGIFLFTRITAAGRDGVPVARAGALLLLADGASGKPCAIAGSSCYGLRLACALGVLTKGLIGVVFPVAIVAMPICC